MPWRRTKHKYRRVEAALGLLRAARGARVLDAPCGEGLLTRALVERGFEVWACDRDPSVLAARDGVRFDVVDLERPLPYADACFDAVVSLEGIEHLQHAAVCVAEFARVLKPGGALVLSTPNVNNVQSRLHYFLTGRFGGFETLARRALEPPAGDVPWHVTVPYLPTLAFLMTRQGLRVDAVTVTMVKTKQWLLLPLALPMWLGSRGRPGMGAMLGSWKLLLGRSVVVRAVKAG